MWVLLGVTEAMKTLSGGSLCFHVSNNSDYPKQLQREGVWGKMEQMNDHIRKLKLYLKWFEEIEEGHIKEKEKLCNTLESVEKKCTEKEKEMAMKKNGGGIKFTYY